MKQNTQNTNRTGFFAEPRAFLSKDGEYLTLVLPGNMIVRKHVNFYKAILGISYEPKKSIASQDRVE